MIQRPKLLQPPQPPFLSGQGWPMTCIPCTPRVSLSVIIWRVASRIAIRLNECTTKFVTKASRGTSNHAHLVRRTNVYKWYPSVIKRRLFTLPSIDNDGKVFLLGVLKNLVWITHERAAVREIIGRAREMRPEAIEDDGRKWTRNRGMWPVQVILSKWRSPMSVQVRHTRTL